ncbi:MAG: MMPL family transporter [Actinobacteria bacterium]|nr:MMPL family transporter [Actinomycetota bacterium]
MSHLLHRLGRSAASHPWRVIGLWVLVAAAAVGANVRWGAPTSEQFAIPGTESQQAVELLQARFPERAGDPLRVVFASDSGAITDPPAAGPVSDALDALGRLDHVSTVLDPLAPGPTRMISEDGKVALATIEFDRPTAQLPDGTLGQVRAALEPVRSTDGLRAELSGALLQAEAEGGVGGSSEVVGVLIAIVVLLVAFGSVAAMGLPIATALFGLLIGLSLLFVSANVLEVNTVGPILASMIGLAVGIDYSLFVVTRHREQLAGGAQPVDAAAHANATAGLAVLFAGGTVVIAMCGLAVVRIAFVTALGLTTAVTVAVAVALAVTLLPALLGLIGHGIDRLRIPWFHASTSATSDPSTWSARWSRAVTQHHWVAIVLATGALVVLALPALSIRLGFASAGSAAEGSTRRQAYDLIADSFGPGYNGPLVVAIDLADADGAVAGQVPARLEALDGVASVSPPIPNADATAAIVQVVPETGPQDQATTDLVDRIRGDVAPAVERELGARLLVGGLTASLIDTTDVLTARTPLFVGVVLAVSFVLLTVVFRSLVVPLKAVVLNLLSIGAATGVVVAIFQWGWGNELLGASETVPIAPFVPMMLFAILFGLSMDYEVFILSRIRERWMDTGDPHQSVVEGLAGSARVVTAAAAIMVAVFASFMFRDQITIKLFGTGLAAAVLLDATLVRLVLVPAAMQVMGRANWWLPRWLDRILPTVDLESDG